MMNIKEYFDLMGKHFHDSTESELTFSNEFTFAIAVVLSAQATDKHVNTVTPRLFAVADTPKKMLKLGEDGLRKIIKSISFFNNKARNIIKMSVVLVEDGMKDGAFPKKYHGRDELVKLPAVGQKSANVITNVLWGAPNIGIDTHLFRLAHRFGWAPATDNTPEKVEKSLMAVLPSKYHKMANHIMVRHGRYICKALRPKCVECPVMDICIWKNKMEALVGIEPAYKDLQSSA